MMRVFLTKVFVYTLGLWLLTGCASMQQDTSVQPVNSNLPLSSGATDSKVKPGMVMELPANNELALDRAEVLKEYHAASGKRCRQLLIGKLSQRTRIMCQQKDGSWEFARALIDSSALQGPLEPKQASSSATDSSSKDEAVIVLAAASDVLQVVPVKDKGNEPDQSEVIAPPLRLRIAEGETLWSFAKRTTGDPMNWSAIADVNNIEDVDNIPGGSFLTVPAKLLAGN